MAIRYFPLLCVVFILSLSATSHPAPRNTITAQSLLISTIYRNSYSKSVLMSANPWVNRNSLIEPMEFDVLGLHKVNITNCTNLSIKQKLQNVFEQLNLFRSPFYIAYSWEKAFRGSHAQVARTLESTSEMLNITCDRLFRYLANSSSPLLPQVSEQSLDNSTRVFLKRQPNLFKGPIPEKKLKGYRNYLIVLSLDRLKLYLMNCLPSGYRR